MKHYSEEEFLNQLLSIPSVNGVDDEREIANFIAEYLKDCKVNVSVREIDQRHANVVAVLGGKSKEKVVWNGIWIRYRMENFHNGIPIRPFQPRKTDVFMQEGQAI